MPVVKHLTKRQKKRKKSQESASASTSASASANESRSDQSQKKGSAGKQSSAVKQNPTANGVCPKAPPVKTVERPQVPRSPARSQTPLCADHPRTTLPPTPEMPENRNQKTSNNNIKSYNNNNNNTNNSNNNINSYNNNNNKSYNNNNNNFQQFSEIPEEDPERDKYYGRHPPNRVLGHMIRVEDYKKIQGAYDKAALGKLKRLQAKKKKLEALAAAAAVSKLLKPKSAEVATTLLEISVEALAPDELHSAKGEAAQLDLAAGENGPLDLTAGETAAEAAPLDLSAGGEAAPLDLTAGEAPPLDLLPAGEAAALDLPAGNATPLDLTAREAALLALALNLAAAGEAAPLDLAAGDAAPLNLAAGEAAPLHLAVGDVAPQFLATEDAAPLDFTAGEAAAPTDFAAGETEPGDATPEELAAAIAEARILMGLGPAPFQPYINGCLDWMPQTETPPPKASVPTVKPQMKPIGYEMLEKKHKLAQLNGGLERLRLDAEYDVLTTAIQMDTKDLVNMSPKDLERAIIDTGFEISELAYGPPELSNWMCHAILSILDKPKEEPKKRIWEPSQSPEPSPDLLPPFSGAQIRAEMERAMAQVPERPLYPMAAQYPNQEQPTYDNIQMPTTYENMQNMQMPTAAAAYDETFQIPPTTYEAAAAQMPPTYDFAPMYDHHQYQQVPPQEAQIQMQSNLPSASVGNRRAPNNHARGRTYYRGGKGRMGQAQRHQNRQHENNNNNNNNNNNHNNNTNNSNYGDRYNNTYNHQQQYFQDINSIMMPPNHVAPVEPPPQHDMMPPMGNTTAQNYGQYQNMPYAPMGYQQHGPGGSQIVHQQQPVANQAANNFVAPPAINQFNNNNNLNNLNNNNQYNNNHSYYNDNNNNQSNNYAPIMPPPPMNVNPNFQSNVNVNNNNLQQLQPQQQKYKRLGNKYSTWGAPNSQEFVPFAGGPGGDSRMVNGHPTPYAPNYGVNMPLQVPCAPEIEYDLTLSDTNFPPLPDPFKNRQEKGKASNNYM